MNSTENKKSRKAFQKSEEFLKTVIDSMNDGIMIIDVNDFGIVCANSFLLKKQGLKEEEIIGKKCFEVSHKLSEPCYLKNEICPLIESVGTGKHLTFEHTHFGKNNEKIYVEVSTSPIKDETGKIVQVIHITRDITERKRIDEDIRFKEERLRQAVRVSQIGIFDHDHRTGTIYWSPEHRQIYGFGLEESITLSAFLNQLYPEDKERITEAVRRAHDPAGDGSFDVEHRIVHRNGSIRWVSTRSITHFEGEGSSRHPVRTIGASVDITERKITAEKIETSLKEKEILLKEIHHRVKNNMQIISSLLMLQSQNIEEKKYKDMFVESQTRIYSMALIHEKLYKSENIAQINSKDYINDIISNIFESYSLKRNIKIEMDIENLLINFDYAVPCGLIINELVTNSLKYAFPDNRHGKIQISFKSIDNNMIQLTVSDDGIGIAKDMDIRDTKSLGLHLVTALAEGQLHGKIILNRERGTNFQIVFGAK